MYECVLARVEKEATPPIASARGHGRDGNTSSPRIDSIDTMYGINRLQPFWTDKSVTIATLTYTTTYDL